MASAPPHKPIADVVDAIKWYVCALRTAILDEEQSQWGQEWEEKHAQKLYDALDRFAQDVER